MLDGSSRPTQYAMRGNEARFVHKTEYHYNQPVTFGPHRAMLRPRERRDVHIVRSRLDVEPPAAARWLRDIYGNSIAILTCVFDTARAELFCRVPDRYA